MNLVVLRFPGLKMRCSTFVVFLTLVSFSLAILHLMLRCLAGKAISFSKVPDQQNFDLFPCRFLVSNKEGDIREPFSSLIFAELLVTCLCAAIVHFTLQHIYFKAVMIISKIFLPITKLAQQSWNI